MRLFGLLVFALNSYTMIAGHIDPAARPLCPGITMPGPLRRCLELSPERLGRKVSDAEIRAMVPERFQSAAGGGQPARAGEPSAFSLPAEGGVYFHKTAPSAGYPGKWETYTLANDRFRVEVDSDKVQKLYVFTLKPVEKNESLVLLFQNVDIPIAQAMPESAVTKELGVGLLLIALIGVCVFWSHSRSR